MEILDGIAAIADRYDGFVLDLWGVVHDGRKPYPGVPEALAELKARGKGVVFLTNAPRRAWMVQKLLDRMELDRALYDGIISSGEISWRHLKRRTDPWFAKLGTRCVHVGPERDLSVVEDGVAEIVTDPREATFLLNTGPDDERGPQSPDPYVPVLEACAAQHLPMVCVNPDRAVMVAGQKLICAGALADIYLGLGGAVREIGKPDPEVYDPVLELLRHPQRHRVLAIGDTPHTDLAGAQAAGLDALWALTGLAAHAHGDNPDPGHLAAVAHEEGVRPIAAVRSLRW
ncbi:TIGR01459 family HAD-type hydrolase [Neoroseomonas oryzicola]|uniref:TIGR01459 family HAD-type hydrolase n=1 Tax=Neoroseomonas oryzicola TaxID=535904 RepID=A0A9X9WL55_9PROT|nr:TIGR01459 family HAD-type hydrolase [Neoroseomonas oryzicola]MBR0661065.1 TIGR01459 family HAD-type hydrolase [Neoroseomonas oryzicola]NKE18286.1 TIGR01459 family HAD-type hydrolase [Neoroseomonas oryzicola]